MQSETPSNYRSLLANRGFQAFLWTQFLGAFNDNVFKMIVCVAAVAFTAGDPNAGSSYLALTGVVFVVPFLVFAGYAGQLADRFSKTQVLILTKSFEIGTMALTIWGFQSRSMPLLLCILFLLATQANFFSPAKYGIIPEMLPAKDLSRANALIELTTFVAIVIGGAFGTLLFEHWKHTPVYMSWTLISLAILGSLFSLGIPKVKSAGSTEPFHWNPFAETLHGFKFLASNKPMANAVAGITVFWFIGGLVQMVLVVFVTDILHGSESQIGILVSALAVGIGVGSMVAGRISGDKIEMGLVAPAAFAMGVAAIAQAFSTSQATSLIFLTAMGFFGGLFIVPLNTYLQEAAEPAELGRVLATSNFANSIGVILASGVLWLLHDTLKWSASSLFLAAGLFTVAVSCYMTVHLLRHSLRFVLRNLLDVLFRFTIRGAEHLPTKTGAVVVPNHTSYADAFLVGAATPRFVRFILWKFIFDNPKLNFCFRLMKTIPINLASKREAVAALVYARQEVEAGEIVGIFPEGQITRTGHIVPLKRGYEKIAESKTGPQAPIIPVWIEGMWGHPLSMKGGGLFQSWDKWLRPRVSVDIGEPILQPISTYALRAKMMELGAHAATVKFTKHDHLGRRFAEAARKQWGNLALADSTGKEVTFGDALTGAVLLKNWLNKYAKGQQRIGLLLPNSAGTAIANIAVALAGRTAVNLNFTAGAASMQSAIEQCGLKTIITVKVFLLKAHIEPMDGVVYLDEVLKSFSGTDKALAYAAAKFAPLSMVAQGGAQEVASIIFSSGSTGEPKGVELTHWNLLSNMEAVAQIYNVGPKDRMLGILPFFHSFGYTYNLWFPLLQQFPVILHTNPSDAKTIGELSEKYKASFLLSTPTFAATYTRKCTREQFATLRYVLVGAEKLRPAVQAAFEEKFGVRMHEGYGCTEMSPVVAVNGPDYISKDPQQGDQLGYCTGSVGRPLPGVALRFVDPATLAPVAEGEEGLMLVKGPSRMRGYLNQPERTAKALVDGYYNTGDMARLDEDGFLHITGRLSRFSKIGGEMVPHLKVEECLQEILEEATCFAIGVPDDQRGERLVVLHTSKDVTAAQMIEHLQNAGLPALWIPKRDQFFFVGALPALGTGKTDLRKAQELAVELMAQTRQPVSAE